MLDLGLDRKEKNKLEYMVFGKKFVIEDKISETTDLVLKFKNFVSEAVKVSPEASLAWAGVCVILPLFTNPSTAYEAQSSGFHYVTSRLQLYAEYEIQVRKRCSVVRDEMAIQLEALLVNLYEELLRFQLSTVVYFYRSWTKNTVKGSLLSDEWESKVNKVKDAEGTVAEYLSRLQETDMISTLKEMKTTANKRCADLKTLLDVSMQTLNVIKDIKYLIESDQRPLDLRIIAEACHNSAEVAARGQCLGGTRSRLKGQIATWFNNQAGPNMLWLTGPAGMGKSTVSLTIADEYAKDRRLAASYFFSRARQGAGEILQFLPTIASQLAQNLPVYKSMLRDALSDMSGETLAKKSLEAQFDILFRGLLEQEDIGSVNEEWKLVVVDALDECKQQTSLRELVDLLAELANLEFLRLRIFITSRDDTTTSAAFMQLQENKYKSLDLHKDFSDESTEDIQSYLTNVFSKTNLAMKTKDPKLLLGDQDLATIIDLATKPYPLFIYASTFHRFLQINSPRRTPRSQLDRWLQNPDGLLPQLTQLYLQVLREAFKPSSDEQDYFTDAETLKIEMMNGKNIITAVVLAAEPLSPCHLACLLRMELHIVTGWLQQLRAVLSAPNDFNEPIHLLHKSFSDFLLHDKNPASEEFRIAMHAGHTLLAEGCLERMRNDGLRRDICGLEKPGVYAMDVEETLIAEFIPGDLAYASRHWLHHLNMAERQLQNLADICEFIEVHLLHWLEALSLLGSIANAILGTPTRRKLI
ncbi:hypothetical protein CRV24_002225 [Beauveria bassiana]|nr:hypothetical protein CRV24_002225 [Beauveria bassiana]